MRVLRTALLLSFIGLFSALPATAQQDGGWWDPVTVNNDRDNRVHEERRRGRTGRHAERNDRRDDEEVRKRRGRGEARGRQGRRGDRQRGHTRRGDDRWEDRQDDDWEEREREDDRWDDDEHARRQRHDKRGGGPPFCRNGQGHPVHGRQWCREKGFGLGERGRWERERGWQDIIFDQQRRRRSESGTILGSDVLGDILDRRLQRRLAEVQRRLGLTRAPLAGRWLERAGARILQLRAGNQPLAELADTDGDRRIDAAFVMDR